MYDVYYNGKIIKSYDNLQDAVMFMQAFSIITGIYQFENEEDLVIKERTDE